MYQLQGPGFAPQPHFQPSFGAGQGLQFLMMAQLMQTMMQLMNTMMGYGRPGGNLSSPHANFGQNFGGGQAMGLPGFLGGGGGSPQAYGGQHAGGGAHSSHGASGAGSTASAGLKNGVAGLTRAQAEDLVRKGGGKVNPGGKATVLALRTKTSATRTYKDTFIVLKPDGSMQPFVANTRPSRSGYNKAMLKPGAYELSPRWRDGKFNNDAFLVKSSNGSMTVGVGRDANGDGVYSNKEMTSNYSSGQIRLHRGRGNNTSSSGCLNCKDYDGFLKSVGGRDASFNMVLVNV